jgi:eukaryotic-like serine/threonine-protein kinase
MLDPQASRFWRAALQSGLIDAEGLNACWEAISPEKRTPDQIDRRLARRAVQAGRLTLWQAQQLLAGRSTGFKIDRYVLLEMIGQGGMGRVYLARDSRLNRRVALKILTPERLNNPRAIQRFQREARVGAQLQHENLVRVYDEGESNGKCYLVMEYIEGRTIGSMIAERGRLDPATAARLTRQVALGLEHAQQKGLIHRDVNPYNVLVTREGTAKLTDLGLAIDLADQAAVTREGATVGTFDYVSPEQARHSHAVDTRSDIYSLGCSLYHMLTGQVPYPSPSLPEKLFGHQALDPEPIRKLAPEVPEGLVEVVRKMMRKKPDDRYATPLELAQALEPFTGESPSASGLGSGGYDLSAPTSGSSGTQPTVTATRVAAARPPEPAVTEMFTPARDGTTADPSPSGSDFGLVLDLGPRPHEMPSSSSPSEPEVDFTALAADKPRAKEDLSGLGLDLESEPPAGGLAAAGLARLDGGRRWLGEGRRWLGVGAAALLLIAVAGVITSGVLGKSNKPAPPPPPPPKGTHGLASHPRPVEPEPAPKEAPPEGKGGTASFGVPIAVMAADGSLLAKETSLKGAMERAIGSKGHVLLDNRTPLKLSGRDAQIAVGGGPLYVRAAEGARPVLEVEIAGKEPFLATRTDTAINLVGVTIKAHYSGKAKDVPPVIRAGATASLERCSFSADGEAKGARAVQAEGNTLVVTGCWFEGFDRAIDIAAFGGSSATVSQCMMIRAGSDDPPTNWAVRVRNMPGGPGKAGRKLLLERCTARGSGLLDLVGFSSASPYKVEVTQCAVLAEALLAWEVAPGEASPTVDELKRALEWKGVGNQYDVHDPSWVVLSPRDKAAMPGGPTDLASWSKLASEADPVPPPITFQDASTKTPKPADFAILDQPVGVRVGAAPGKVGPAAKRKVAGKGTSKKAGAAPGKVGPAAKDATR